MINEKLFFEDCNQLIQILDNSRLSEKEKQYRKNKIRAACEQLRCSSNKYFELAHEIRALEYLEKKPGKLTPAKDSKSKPGADFVYNDVQIECVVSSKGSSDYDNYDVLNTIVDYDKKRDIVLTRFTNTISAKEKFYNEHIQNGSIPEDAPFIIFLSCGEMAYGTFFDSDNALDFAGVLFGIDKPLIRVDHCNKSIINVGYTTRETILKNDTSPIGVNLFKDVRYSFISAILFTSSELCTEYSSDNTFLFINPLAKHAISVADFNDLNYWSINSEGEYYCCRAKK